jgi:hypothetical protein
LKPSPIKHNRRNVELPRLNWFFFEIISQISHLWLF